MHKSLHYTAAARLVPVLFFIAFCAEIKAQEGSVAQNWNEACLTAISRDFARPTVHARNLFHHSIAMYDAWAAYDPAAEPYLLGRTRGSYFSPFNGVAIPINPEEVEAARETAISFAVYRLLRHRFLTSPGGFLTLLDINQRMSTLGLDVSNTSTDYVNGGAAELGNYIAQQIINFGFTDGANESADYANQVYQPVNPNILPEVPGTNGIVDPNRWQAISLSVAIDQSGNLVSDPPHLTPEWGNVVPFSMNESNKSVLERDGTMWNVYNDPGTPPLLDTTITEGLESLWKWNFCLVHIWQSHLDPDDETLMDASPLTIGNIQNYPQTQEDYPDFYNLYEGGTNDPGHTINPITGAPYEPQIVKRGDYGRVVAEFWADGPNSYTPPGHWFHIYNEIRHHALWENKWMGEGPELNDLEMDVKSYLTIGGAMHDAAITAWSIKGYYDYLRPVSAIRYMCEMGQCTNPEGSNFHAAGMPLVPGYIEQVEVGDPLAGSVGEHVGKIKLYTWKGPDYIDNAETDFSGVGWILGENWWPYQRPTFVTPPFSGFISGHSTFSRTAAEVFTLITGSQYFPGGMSNFEAPQDDFLEFEIGPSETVFLQWATYQDASDQCSLSRIWGGIHPPADDIPGRLIGMELGPQVFNFANNIFTTDRPIVTSVDVTNENLGIADIGSSMTATVNFDRPMNTAVVPAITFLVNDPLLQSALSVTEVQWINDQQYQIEYNVENSNIELFNIFMRIGAAQAADGTVQNIFLKARPFVLDTKRPELVTLSTNSPLLNDASAVGDGLVINLHFSEDCDENSVPEIVFESSEDLESILTFNPALSSWVSPQQFEAHFDLTDNDDLITNIGIAVSGVNDLVGNEMLGVSDVGMFSIDTQNPDITSLDASNQLLNVLNAGANALTLTANFDKPMNTTTAAAFAFPNQNPLNGVLVLNTFSSGWVNDQTFVAVYNQQSSEVELFDIEVELVNFVDLAGNAPVNPNFDNLFAIDTKRPDVQTVSPNGITLADADAAGGTVLVEIEFSEPMDQSQLILMQLSGPGGIASSLAYNPFLSNWNDGHTFNAVFNFSDQNVELEDIQLQVSFGSDLAGNIQNSFSQSSWINIDTKNPDLAVLFANVYTVTASEVGSGGFSLLALFNEAMDTDFIPSFDFDADGNPGEALSFNSTLSGWENFFTYHAYFDVTDTELALPSVAVAVSNAFDLAGNVVNPANYDGFFAINIQPLSTSGVFANSTVKLYPNPLRAGSSLNLEVGTAHDQVRFKLFSANGQMVSDILIPHLYAGQHQITPPTLAPGLYFARLESELGNATFKLVSVE